ncbi:hypothetical protein Esti_004230 [Eimeria stiedai]
MENESFDYVTDILGCTYTGIAREARKSRTCLVNSCIHSCTRCTFSLLAQRQLPVEGWSSLEVKQLLCELSATDGNSQLGQASVGEREGRVFSEMAHELPRSSRREDLRRSGVRALHLANAIRLNTRFVRETSSKNNAFSSPPRKFRMLEELPCSICMCGFSRMSLQNDLYLEPPATIDAHEGGKGACENATAVTHVDKLLIIEMKSIYELMIQEPQLNMFSFALQLHCSKALMWYQILSPAHPPKHARLPLVAYCLCLSALRRLRPHADVVVVSRIDQKSCIKAVSHAGLKLQVVDQLVGEDGALVTDLNAIQRAIAEATPRVLCVMSTTSSFAPRQPDLIPQIAEMCKKMGVFHLVNNAYGLQCSKCCALVEQACRGGQVDLVVSSCDKNFLTPVGGSLVYGPDPQLVAKVSASYPGRASMSPILDLFITLLQMGQTGLQHLLRERKRLFSWFKEELVTTCEPRGLRVLPSPHNKISIALDLSALAKGGREDTAKARLRVVVPSTAVTEIAGHPFRSFGSHCEYPVPYCSVACAIGADEKELRLFLERFRHLVDRTLTAVRATAGPPM